MHNIRNGIRSTSVSLICILVGVNAEIDSLNAIESIRKRWIPRAFRVSAVIVRNGLDTCPHGRW